jgi:hypothetical protein
MVAARRLLLPALLTPLLAGGVLVTAQAVRARAASAAADPATLARQAVSENPATARAAIAALRARGPAGLDTLFAAYGPEIARHDARNPRGKRIAAALDGVARQKDAWASRLYWHTDLAAARKEAEATGKPILSLRLLGNLDQELSCANSRFFRTALYPDAAVSAYLRDHFVLHWQSERPVPVFTLDFGDGRKVVRTLTGNSIHYVLDAKGRPVDALPGLYGPKAFLRALKQAEPVAREAAALADGDDRQFLIAGWHKARFDALTAAWKADCAVAYGRRAGSAPELARLIADVGVPRSGAPAAMDAAPLAVAKVIGEGPVVRALSPGGAWALGATALDWAWDQIGQVHAADAVLDANARAVIASKNPDLTRVPAAPPAPAGPGLLLVSDGGRPSAPQPAYAPPAQAMDRLVANFERAMAQDTAHNEYVFHAKLHQWFMDGRATGDLATLNRHVYADLFLTPSTDPWLGLAPGGAYTALSDDGLIGGPAPQAPPAAARTARR